MKKDIIKTQNRLFDKIRSFHTIIQYILSNNHNKIILIVTIQYNMMNKDDIDKI